MSDRLDELNRQRALLQEHLLWLDREIERERGGAPAAAQADTRLPASRAPLPLTAAVGNTGEPIAEEILDQFGSGPENLQADTRKGCLTLFFVALGLLFCGFGIAYYVYTTRAPAEQTPAVERSVAPLPRR